MSERPIGATFIIGENQLKLDNNRIRFIHREPLPHNTICRWCGGGSLAFMGSVMQYGMWEDHHWAVFHCGDCDTLTVYTYGLPIENEAERKE